MKWIAIFAAKVVFCAAVIYGLYSVSHLNHRSLTAWTADNPADVGKPVSPKRSPATSEPRRATSEAPCAAQTWPHIRSDCIAGRVQPARHDPAPAASVAPATPAAEITATSRSELVDPAHTGSLPRIGTERDDRSAQARGVSSRSRETRKTVSLRNRHYAARPIRQARWAAQPRPWASYEPRRLPRTAYVPWSNPNQYWRDGRPEW
jgi:hypothetical protein